MKDLIFRLGNNYIERQIYISHGVPYKSVIRNKVSGMEWESDGREPLLAFQGLDLEDNSVCLEENAIVIYGDNFTIRWEFRAFEQIPMIESRVGIKGTPRTLSDTGMHQGSDRADGVENRKKGNPIYKDYVDGFGCASKHVTLKTVEFFDRTDITDYLVEEKEIPLYSRNAYWGGDGQLFVLQEKLSGDECIVVKNAPCGIAHYNKRCRDLIVNPISNMHIGGSGIDMSALSEEYIYSYPVAVGLCGRNESRDLFLKYYEEEYKIKTPYIMSNTWGDRNCDKCVCEEFILREIDIAAQLGVDVVQIDDGWQKGITSNSVLASGGCWSGGYRAADPAFWSVNLNKFPDGFDRIIKAANAKNISIGLWFAPDGADDYSSWEQDGQVLLDFYRQYGIRYFKLDSIRVVNRICEQNLVKLFAMVREQSHDQIVLNMDITSGLRFGYLAHKEFGDIFVENRYTDWGNYYPHNTLRNLWELSKYIPAQRLQMELLNPKRNQTVYHDILAPAYYDMDYLFATVMTANPLVWMEMTGLDEGCRMRLARIIAVYKQYREDFKRVEPILEKPSGFSLTGFKIYGKKHNYVLLLRELSDVGGFDISVKEILATNDETAQMNPVHLSKKQGYLFGIL